MVEAGKEVAFKSIATAFVVALGILIFGKINFLRVKNAFKISPFFSLYCAWLLFSQLILSVVYGNTNSNIFFIAMAYVLIAFISFILIPEYLDKTSFIWLTISISVIGVSSSIACILNVFFGIDNLFGLKLASSQYMDVLGLDSGKSFFRQRTAYGAQVFLGFCCSVYIIFLGRRYLGIVFSAICLVGTFLSWARSVWLALLISVSIWFYYKYPKFSVFFCMPIIGTLLVVTITQYFGIFSDIAILERGLSQREKLWPVAIELITEKPLLGYGMGTTADLRARFASYSANRFMFEMGRISGFHNNFIEIAIMAGIPVAIFLALIFFFSLRRIIASNFSYPLKCLVLSVCIGMLTISFFTPYSIGGIRNPALIMSIFWGIANFSQCSDRYVT